MAGWKSIVGKYIKFGEREKKDHWTCDLCQHSSNGRPNRIISHLTRIPGNGVKICEKITSEQVEELKRELGLGSGLTGADGQQPQQPGDSDDIRPENGNKKRKSLWGSGSSQREYEMSPSGALNPSSALGESSSVSGGNVWSLENLEKSVGATDNPEHNASLSVFDFISFPRESWDGGPMMTSSGAYVQNTDNGGFEGTNAVGSPRLLNIIHQWPSSSSQGHVDHRNDQHTHPPTSTLRNAYGVEMGGETVLTDEPQPPCPPGFNRRISPVSVSVSGSGTSGSNQREAEMSPLGADGNILSLQNPENSIGETETHDDDAPMMALPETSHDQEWAYVLNTDNGGFQGTNAVGSSGLPSIIHQGQYSSSQGQVDHRNDQHTPPHTSTRRDAFGVEPQPPCPPGFNPDLWKIYLELDTKKDHRLGGNFSLYKKCMSSTDEEERKVMLGLLESACSRARDLSDSSPRCDPSMLRVDLWLTFCEKRLSFERNRLKGQASRVGEIERETTKEANQGDQKLVEKWNNDRKRWVGHAATFKSDVGDLNDAASNVTSLQLQEILELLSRAHKLRKIGETVIKTGTALLNPVPKDISHWNPTYMSCGSQFVNQNQMPPTQFAPHV